MSKLKIAKNKEKIVKLLNENIDLEYKILVKSMSKIYENEVNTGTKKSPKMVNTTVGCWKEYFMDEDANEKIEVERKIIIAVEGKPSDHWNVLKYYTIEDV